MAGLDLPVKLRRGLGKGKVVPAEELSRRLLQFDGDGDGNLSREDLTRFFLHHRVGGPWFCEVLTKTLWDIAEDRWSEKIDSITAVALGRVISYSMGRPARRTTRYVITPEAAQGLEEKRTPQEMLAAQQGRSPPVRRPPAPSGRAHAPRARLRHRSAQPAATSRTSPAPVNMPRLPSDARGARMDHAVHRLLETEGRRVSVREVRQALRQGTITVAGRSVPPGRTATGGESVEVERFVAKREVVLTPAPDLARGIIVVADEPDLLALDKPPGLPTHPLRPEETETLLQAALAIRPEILDAGPPMEGGLLHRLDTGTSGVVLFATSRPAREALRAAFAAHRVDKSYLALTVLPPWSAYSADGRIDGAGPSVRLRDADDARGLPAHTDLEVVRRAEDRAWIRARTRTGRRHQVRAHAAGAGAPLWGDPLYGGPPAARLALHAEEVRLPDGRTFRASLPADLVALLEAP